MWRFLKKKKKKATNRTTYGPTFPFLGIYLKKMEILIWKDISALMFIEALFTIAKMWKKFKCPSVKKMWCIHTHTHTHTHTQDYYSTTKKNWNIRGYDSKCISQTKPNTVISCARGILKKWINMTKRNKVIDTKNKQVADRGEGGRKIRAIGDGNWEVKTYTISESAI